MFSALRRWGRGGVCDFYGNPGYDKQPILYQSDFTSENTVYVVRYDFILGEDITVPENCVLEFDGGSLSGDGTGKDTITGANTYLSNNIKLNCNAIGAYSNPTCLYSWFINSNNSTNISRLLNIGISSIYIDIDLSIDSPILIEGKSNLEIKTKKIIPSNDYINNGTYGSFITLDNCHSIKLSTYIDSLNTTITNNSMFGGITIINGSNICIKDSVIVNGQNLTSGGYWQAIMFIINSLTDEVGYNTVDTVYVKEWMCAVFTQAPNTLITNVTCIGATDFPFALNSFRCTNSIIRNCNVNGNVYQRMVAVENNAYGVLIEGCKCVDSLGLLHTILTPESEEAEPHNPSHNQIIVRNCKVDNSRGVITSSVIFTSSDKYLEIIIENVYVDGNFNGDIFLNIMGVSNIYVKNCYFNTANSSVATNVIYNSNVKIEDSDFSGGGQSGIIIRNGADVTINDCRFNGHTWCIKCDDGTNPEVTIKNVNPGNAPCLYQGLKYYGDMYPTNPSYNTLINNDYIISTKKHSKTTALDGNLIGAKDGDSCFNITSHKLLYYTGTAWVDATGTPV